MGEGYHATYEIGFWKLIKYFLILALICIAGTWISTRFLNLDVLVLMWFWTNPIALVPVTVIIAGSLWIRSKYGGDFKGETSPRDSRTGKKLSRDEALALSWFQAHPEMGVYYASNGQVYRRGGVTDQ